MSNTAYLGYLTEPYLEGDYAGDTGLNASGMGVLRQIRDFPKTLGMAVERQIVDKPRSFGSEVRRQIADRLKPAGMETNIIVIIGKETGSQVERFIDDFPKEFGSQTALTVKASKSLGSEVFRQIKDFSDARGIETNRVIVDFPKPKAMEIRRDKSLASWLCEGAGYLDQGYLEGPYLTATICAQMGHQVSRFLNKLKPTGMEVNRIINATKPYGSEVLRQIVDKPVPLAMQVDRLGSKKFGMQTRLVLYNTNLLRILVEFPSRGLTGENWTATSTAPGDYSPNNLNTDIVEQVWKTNNQTSAILICDTEITQGVAIDTLAILNHNLTRSAQVRVEGAADLSFNVIKDSFNLTATTEEMYYVAPVFPSTQSRYWRFIINDTTNPDGFLQIGTIIFGTSIIFQGESFVDQVLLRNTHFADKVATEGFTNVTNDRALKRGLTLEFRAIDYGKGNYNSISSIFNFARTSLKCLWIPDPKDPKRFATFGKLATIPEETHLNMGPGAADIIDFTVEVDESL